jgi:P-type Ca2+ transporter type 2C
MILWHTLSLAQVEKETGVDLHRGLSNAEAEKRLAISGANMLPVEKPDSYALIFFRQFRSPLIYILLVASVIVYFLDEHIDAALILIVLLFNAIVGAIQEGKAQRTLEALKKFSETSATVIREGKEIILSDKEIVPGDVLVLHEGEKVAADARIIESRNLRADEAALTGESVPVHKVETVLHSAHAGLTDQVNMLFKGSAITGGFGKAIVTATGANSAIGRISQAIAHIDGEIPLQKNLNFISKVSVIGIGIVCAIVFLVGLYSGKSIQLMFATTVSFAISIIPEGLPVILTLILAQGMWRMAKRQALVKKLQAVEALGEAKIIAVDKTGTLTKNEMVIRSVFVDSKMFAISGTGYDPTGEVRLGDKITDAPNHPELLLMARIASFGASAQVVFSEEGKFWKVAGDPTEAAMLVFGEKLGFHKEDLEQEFPLISERPFDYKVKFHLTSHQLNPTTQFVSVAGAPEAILEHATKIHSAGKSIPLTPQEKGHLIKIFHHMSRIGLRVVACGYKELPTFEEREVIEPKGLVFAGFFGIEDSLRPEVPDAMRKARAAGIRVVMITGDSKLTAEAIAREAGIWSEGDETITGDELETLHEKELDNRLSKTSVFARVTPEHKMQIIQAYKRRGEIIAMTGDGVNDAPSLVAADLGVAMGKIGTEVAKEASDIVLLDDNFGTIVSAVEEGRHMFATIRKTILFLFSTNLGEIIIITGAIFTDMPVPLLAAQILWLNLITDSPVAFALAFDPKEGNLLDDVRARSRKLIDWGMVFRMFVMAVPMGIATLYVFQSYEHDTFKAWTIVLTILAVFQWLNGLNCRSETASVFRTNPFSNPYLVLSIIVTAGLHVAALSSPFMQGILHVTPLSLAEWGLVTGVAGLVIVSEELRKLAVRLFMSPKIA